MQEAPIDIDEVSSPPAQKEPAFAPFLRMVKRRAFLILGISGMIIGIGASMAKKPPDTYQGTFQLLVEPATTEARFSNPAALSRDQGIALNRDVFTLDYPTQLQILQTPTVLASVARQVQEKFPDFTYDALTQGLVVKRTGTNLTDATKIIEVTYEGDDPGLVQLVLEKLSQRYLRYSLEDRKTRLTEGVRFIEDQLPALEKQVDELQAQLEALQQQNNLMEPVSQGQQIFAQLQQIITQRSQAQQQLQEQRTLYQNLQQQLQLSPTEAIVASTLSEDPRYQQTLNSLQEIETQLATETTRFSEASPIVRRLRERQANLTNLLNQEAQQILGQNLADANHGSVLAYQNSVRLALIKQLIDTVNQIQVLQVRIQTIAQSQATLEQQAKALPSIARRYNQLQQQLTIANQTLQQLLTQRETLKVEAAQNQMPWEIISAPEIPKDAAGNPIPLPSKPSKQLMIVVVLGIVLGLGSAIVLEKYQNIFYDLDDLRASHPSPLLGALPLTSNPTFADSIEALYANIHFLQTDSPLQSIVICSAMSGDGKTTIASQLAQTAAATGQRVLLVDANFRSPRIHHLFNISNHKGLSDLLLGNVVQEDVIQTSSAITTLAILPTGQSHPNVAKLLASPQLQSFVNSIQKEFDLIIYDTPPLNQFVDANYLASHTNGILLVVKLKTTHRTAVKQTIERSNSFRLPILGLIANDEKEAKKLQTELVDENFIIE